MWSTIGLMLLLFVGAVLAARDSPAGRLLRTAGGAVVGTAAGLGVTVGIVVARTHFDNRYLESTRDLLDWQLVPVPMGTILGAAAGWAGPVLLAGMALGAVGGAAFGALAGAAVGAALAPEPMYRWAGGTMGGALGIVLGVVIGLWLARRRSRVRRVRVAAPAALLAMAVGSLPGCSRELPELPDVPPAPQAAAGEDVESVVYLLGDPGRARYLHYPILPRLARDVEEWSARLERDSSVVVLVLGDMVYPDGMHPPGTEGFRIDSARVADQIDVIRGPMAQRSDAFMYFMAGNHDWGLMEERPGARRLRNLGAFLDRVRSRGPLVDLVPRAGTGMPYVVDVGERLRLVLLDTAWWLFDAEPRGKPRMVRGVDAALATAGDRAVVLAAHHPYESAGPHGGFRPVWTTLGIRQLLARSGAILQDLDSRPYRELIRALEEVFAARGRPLLFAGGHEHSLQLIRHGSAGAPRYSAVSGSASKLTDVGYVDGMLFGRSAPGYMRLLVRENGAVDFFVEAAPERFLACPENEPREADWERCMDEGLEAYRTVFSTRIREPVRVRQPGTALHHPNRMEEP